MSPRRVSNISDSGLSFSLALVSVLFVLLLPLAGIAKIDSSSEAREAHIARGIYQGGEIILPRRNNILPSKPPLYHWVAAVGAGMLGYFDETVARLPSLVFGLLLILLVSRQAFVLTRRHCKNFDARSSAILAAFSLTLLYGFASAMIDCKVDMTMSFFVCAAVLYAASKLERHGFPARAPLTQIDWIIFYSLCGLAVLTKGPLGLVLPLISVCALFSAHLGIFAALRILIRPNLGWAALLMISLPWYVMAAQLGHEAFVDRQIVFENFQRFFGGERVNKEAFWYYLPSFLRTAFPWSLILVFFAWRDIAAGPRIEPGPEPAAGQFRRTRLGYLAWFAAGVLFFSLSVGKRHSYLLPLYPAVALYVTLSCAQYWAGLSHKLQASIFSALTLLQTTALAIAVGVIAWLSLARDPGLLASLGLYPWQDDTLQGETLKFFSSESYRLTFVFGAVLFLGVASQLLRRRVAEAWSLRWLCLSLCFIGFISIGNALKAAFKDFEETAQEIKSLTAGSDLLVVKDPFDEYLDPVLYYLARPVTLVASLDEVDSSADRLVLARRALINRSQESLAKTRLKFIKDFPEALNPFAGAQKLQAKIEGSIALFELRRSDHDL